MKIKLKIKSIISKISNYIDLIEDWIQVLIPLAMLGLFLFFIIKTCTYSFTEIFYIPICLFIWLINYLYDLIQYYPLLSTTLIIIFVIHNSTEKIIKAIQQSRYYNKDNFED